MRVVVQQVAVVVLSLVAALLFAVSARLQQRAAGAAVSARSATGGSRWLPIVATFGRLVRDRLWLLGWVANVGAFLIHAVALHLGTITVVQSLILVQLIFAQLMLGHRPVARDWLGSAAVCAGLILLLLVRRTASTRPDRTHVPLAILVAAAAIVVLIVIARFLPKDLGWLRGGVVGLGAGICFSLTAVFVVLAGADLARGGVWGLLTDWAWIGVAASTTASTVLVQDAFGAGSLAIAMTAMTIADPVSSAVIDLLVLEPTRPGPLALAGYALVGVLLTAGVILLIGSPTRRAERSRPAADPVSAST